VLRNSLIEASLYYHLQHALKGTFTNQLLTTNDYLTYISPYKNLLPLEPVFVYKNGEDVTAAVKIYYPEGKVVFEQQNSSSDNITLSASYCLVDIKTTYEESFVPPVVLVDVAMIRSAPLELGTVVKRRNVCNIEIIAYTESKVQVNELLDMVVGSILGGVPIIDYNQGFPLNSDGTKNINYTGPIIGYLELSGDIVVRDLGYVELINEAYAYCGIVELEMEEF
jgi:hypothetical protein